MYSRKTKQNTSPSRCLLNRGQGKVNEKKKWKGKKQCISLLCTLLYSTYFFCFIKWITFWTLHGQCSVFLCVFPLLHQGREREREGKKEGGKDVGNVLVKRERMCRNYFLNKVKITNYWTEWVLLFKRI